MRTATSLTQKKGPEAQQRFEAQIEIPNEEISMSNVVAFPGKVKSQPRQHDDLDQRFNRFLIKTGIIQPQPELADELFGNFLVGMGLAAKPTLVPDERYWPQRETVPAPRRHLEAVA